MNLPKIQYITRDDAQMSHAEQARVMFENGISWVQLRMKNSSHEEILTEAQKAIEFAKALNGTLIINDSVEIALEVGAHGVHVGLLDQPVDEIRKRVGSDFIIGGTANTLTDIWLQQSRGADYIGVGPYRFTTTKKNLSPIVGLAGYQILCKVLKNNTVPLVAVGGITMEEIPQILATGMKGVAISGDLLEHLKNKKVSIPES